MLEGYQEYDAIIGNGASYLDLPFNLTGNTKIVVDYTLLSGRNGGMILGNHLENPTYIIIDYIITARYAGQSISRINVSNIRQSITLDGNILYKDKWVAEWWNYVDYHNTTPLRLMGSYATSSFLNKDIKVHNYKIAEDSTSDWLFDLVPAKRLSDNKPGWYNKVDDTFYPSSSSTDFTLGYPIFDMNKIKKLQLLSSPDAPEESGLPDGYQPYESIIGNGASYLDLPFNLTGNTKIVVDYTILDIRQGVNGRLFGNRQQNKTSLVVSYENNNYINYAGNDDFEFVGSIGKHSVMLDGNHLYYDFTHIKTWDYVEFQHTTPLRLMGYYEETSYLGTKTKVHNFKIAEDSTSDWLFDLVPAKRLSDNKPGWYNKIDDTFYPSSSNADFTLGNPLINKNLKRLAKESGTIIWNHIPAEYQEVEYLKSTGTQYIDTGILPKADTEIHMRMCFMDSTTTQNFFGCRQNTTADNTSYNLFYNVDNSNKIRFDWLLRIDQSFVFSKEILREEDVHIKVKFPNAIVNGETFVQTGENTKTDSLLSMILFGCNNANTIVYSRIKLYYFKVFNGDGTLMASMIPCYRKSDNKPGMYDKVTGNFLTNAGTGEFIVGGDV